MSRVSNMSIVTALYLCVFAIVATQVATRVVPDTSEVIIQDPHYHHFTIEEVKDGNSTVKEVDFVDYDESEELREDKERTEAQEKDFLNAVEAFPSVDKTKKESKKKVRKQLFRCLRKRSFLRRKRCYQKLLRTSKKHNVVKTNFFPDEEQEENVTR